MKQIAKKALCQFFRDLKNDYKIYVPAVTGKTSAYLPYSEEVNLLTDGKTVVSPKGIFFPAMEKMYQFKVQKTEVTITAEELPSQPQLLWGLRTCDVQGIICLDKVFLGRNFADSHYQKRRENSLLFALACNDSAATCFCQSLGLDPQGACGADVQVYENAENYFFTAVSQAGHDFMEEYETLFSEGEAFSPTPFQQSLSVDMAGVPEKMSTLFAHSMWQKLARACIGCSTCAYLCPTCYCFDLTTKHRGETGVKYRTWDCCMFSDYTLMAGGHNPRPGQTQRVRNRMMDKLVYNRERHGKIFCVGCGRCLAKCPVNIDITKVIKQVKEAE